MRRVVAFVVAQVLAASSAMGTAVHVHEYLDHDHPAHHHGPAAHTHDPEPADDAHHRHAEDEGQPAIHVGSCDPGSHAVAMTMDCAAVPQAHADIAAFPGPASVAAIGPIRAVAAVTDIRVHGPPFDAGIPPRAPPLPRLD